MIECSEQVIPMNNIDQTKKIHAPKPYYFETFKSRVVQGEKYPIRSFGQLGYKSIIRYINEVLEQQRYISSLCASETNIEIVYSVLSPAVKIDGSEKENV